MTPDEAFSTAVRIGAVIQEALAVPLADAEAYATVARQQVGHFDAVVALVDPARWMKDRRSVMAAGEAMEAFLKFRRVLEGQKA